MKKCFFIANNTIAEGGLSGGDRIYIELARRWKRKTDLTILATEETISVVGNAGLSDLKFIKICPKLGIKNVFILRAIFFNLVKKLVYGVIFVIRNRKLFKEPKDLKWARGRYDQ